MLPASLRTEEKKSGLVEFTNSSTTGIRMRHADDVLVVTSCLSVFVCGRTLAQTAEELVNKNIQAKGGVEKIKSAKTRLTVGRSRALADAELQSQLSNR